MKVWYSGVYFKVHTYYLYHSLLRFTTFYMLHVLLLYLSTKLEYTVHSLKLVFNLFEKNNDY